MPVRNPKSLCPPHGLPPNRLLYDMYNKLVSYFYVFLSIRQLIPASKVAELQHLLAYLLKRSESKEFRECNFSTF